MQDPSFLRFDSDVRVSSADEPNDLAEATDPGYESDGERKEIVDKKPQTSFTYTSSGLPFGQHVSLSSLDKPGYLTAQSLIQQVAFHLSDKIFSYSPETFDLDISLKSWRAQAEKNVWGYETGLSSLETRAGAGQIALGYIFSKDFDLTKRHIPQTIVASSSTLQHLHGSLDQLSLLYSVASPVVAHVAAVEYSPNSPTGLVTDYITAMAQAEDLGLGLISSTSTFEAQHMSLLATLLANVMPTVHIYDGVNVGRETTRVADVLSQKRLHSAWQVISQDMFSPSQKRFNNEAKLVKLLDTFNEELGTDYKPFEYYGHAEPETVLVVFGSVEGSIAAQLAFALSNNGVKVGAINVRVYRPFIEDDFIEALPASVKSVSVLGQVKDKVAVLDAGESSLLYRDVFAAVALSSKFSNATAVVDLKYAKDEVWTPSKFLYLFQHAKGPLALQDLNAMEANNRVRFDLLGPSVTRYTFWDADDSPTAHVPVVIGQLLSQGPADNIQLRNSYDNLTQGGIVRTDVRSSAKSIEAPYSISNSNLTFVGDEKVLASYNVAGSLQSGGQIIVSLPGAKGQDMDKIEKRLSSVFLKDVTNKHCRLHILDPTASSLVAENSDLQSILTQLAFLRFAWSDESFSKIEKLAAINGDVSTLRKLTNDLDTALWRVELSHTWATLDTENSRPPTEVTANSFVGFDKTEEVQVGFVKSWITAAKGLAFKEVTGTKMTLRPDLGVKTAVVHVKERRRLTPETYDRNIFHIEFDLGDSGVTYKIGEALGIHAENDERQVREFIDWYGLSPTDIVEVPSRENFDVLENCTVLQALLKNVDIFGRPPKRFYEQLSEFATDHKQAQDLLALGTGSTAEAAQEFKRRGEVDTITYADILMEYSSAHPSFADLVRIVAPMKRREYSIASSQKVTPNSVSLLIVTVGWVDPQGRDRFGQATRYLNSLSVGSPVTVSVKPSVMKLPPKTTAPLIMAGLGTGLAPFRAFVQERAWQKQQGMEIGEVLLYMGSRHQREEYLYGEEWEAYQDAGIITLLGRAFSRDQPAKIYIQDRMRQTLAEIRQAYLQKEGSFYLCGPTWPVPDVTEVLQEAVEVESIANGGKKLDGRKEIEKFKEEERYVLEVY